LEEKMPVLYSTTKMTVDEFLSLPETDEHLELVDGEIVVSPKPKTSHQILTSEIYMLLRMATNGLGRVVPEKELVVDSEVSENVRVPDLMYICEDRKGIVFEDAIRGAPDIAVEVLSPSTEEVDRISKRDEYEDAGVKEYWIVDPDDRAVLIHDFKNDTHQVYAEGESFVSSVLAEQNIKAEFKVKDIFIVLDK